MLCDPTVFRVIPFPLATISALAYDTWSKWTPDSTLLLTHDLRESFLDLQRVLQYVHVLFVPVPMNNHWMLICVDPVHECRKCCRDASQPPSADRFCGCRRNCCWGVKQKIQLRSVVREYGSPIEEDPAEAPCGGHGGRSRTRDNRPRRAPRSQQHIFQPLPRSLKLSA